MANEGSEVAHRLLRGARAAGFSSAAAGLVVLLVERGLSVHPGPGFERTALWLYTAAAAVFLLELIPLSLARRPLKVHYRGLLADGVVALAVLALLVAGRPRAAFAVAAGRQIVVALATATRAATVRTMMEFLEGRPTRMVAVSFLAAILVGTGLLLLPASSADGRAASPVDAVFTATSSVCVTGLIVRSTPHDWSRFGQWVILALIQAGGLGIMALSVSLVMLLGRKLRVRHRAALFQAFDAGTMASLRANLRYLLFLSLVFEALGFVVLTLRFRLDVPDWGRAAWLGLFHSVSAWNNAGFSLWDDSLTAYRSDLLVNLTVAALVIAGGLGFAVLGQVADPSLLTGRREPRRRFSTHTRLVLTTSAILLVLGTLVVFFVEYDHGLAGMGPGDKLLAAFFHSTSARTAGFNTVDLARFSPEGLLALTVLMFIGASPGSTGGGIKTTTLAVLVLAVRAILLNRPEVEVFGRRIERIVILKAVAIVVVSICLVLLFFGLLLALEPGCSFRALLFETVSAFGTVGLSTGITPRLGAPAKLALTVLMFVGRTGPLTMALAIGDRGRRKAVQFPEGRVAVG